MFIIKRQIKVCKHSHQYTFHNFRNIDIFMLYKHSHILTLKNSKNIHMSIKLQFCSSFAYQKEIKILQKFTCLWVSKFCMDSRAHIFSNKISEIISHILQCSNSANIYNLHYPKALHTFKCQHN